MLAFVALIAGTVPLAAQSRRTLSRRDPETQLMGYYAAVMQFTPVGVSGRDGRLEIGGAVSYIPTISLEDRTVGFGGTKPENTNLCDAFPRLVVTKGFGRVRAELGFTPHVTVCGVTAGVTALAVGYRFPMSATWDGEARLSALSGSVDAPITCSADAVADPLDQTCYGGTVSADRMAPRAAAVDFVAAWQGWRAHRIEPYVVVGVRYERVDFDVNYTRDTAQAAAVSLPPLSDHNRLRGTLQRVHLGAGAAWDVTRFLRLGGEVYYAPGAVFTARGRVSLVLGRVR